MLELIIQNGPLIGKKYLVGPKTTIGRHKASITLHDPKVSGIHCRIESDPNGELVIIDNNSRNGIIYKGKKVAKLKLIPGLIFILGSTAFGVAKIEVEQTTTNQEGVNFQQEPTKQKSPSDQQEIIDNKSVKEHFLEELKARESMFSKEKPTSVQLFKYPLKLNFIQGIQSDTEWILGYGPRVVGTESLDLEINEKDAPDICFELVPQGKIVLFKTDHPNIVKLNDKPLPAMRLKEGDQITIGLTKIRVSFMKETII